MANFIKNFSNFTKIEHTVFSLPLLYSGAYIGNNLSHPAIKNILLILVAGTGARILGMAMNRILDRDIDAKNPRTKNRELPAGKLKYSTAVLIALIGLAVYLSACYAISSMILFLSPVPAVFLIVYSLLKRFTPLCHFGIGLCLLLAPLGAYVVITQNLIFGPAILFLSGFAFFWMSGFDIIYSLQDMDFDRENNVKSIPASFGPVKAQVVAGLCHLTAMLLLILLALSTYKSAGVILVLLIAFLGFVCAYLPWISLEKRFFPASAIVGIAGALVPFL